MRRIGIMGGTFNPPHMGHLMLAEWAREAAKLDEVVFMPAGFPYMKEDDGILSGDKRLRMTQLATQGYAAFSVSDFEVSRDGYTYTCETMEQLHKAHPTDHYYFIIGADCLFTMEKWKDPERIFASCTVLAASRNGSPMEKLGKKRQELEKRYQAEILLVQFPSIEISSTMIRERARLGRSLKYLVPDPLIEYITENGLYKG